MEIDNTLLLSDRDRQFDDWGETITFRKVSQTFDTQTGELIETYTDTELTAMVGTQPQSKTSGTACQHVSQQLYVQVKAEEVPANEPTTGSRLLRASKEYDILDSTLSAAQLVRTFVCRKRF